MEGLVLFLLVAARRYSGGDSVFGVTLGFKVEPPSGGTLACLCFFVGWMLFLEIFPIGRQNTGGTTHPHGRDFVWERLGGIIGRNDNRLGDGSDFSG